MKITLKRLSNRYGFDISDEKKRCLLSSDKQYFLIPHLQSSYKYAWEACRDAWKLANKSSYHIRALRFAIEDMVKPVIADVAAEDMIIDHYLRIYKELRVKSQGSEEGDEEERDITYQELKKVTEEINNIMEQIKKPEEKNTLRKVLQKYDRLISKYFPKEKAKDESEKESVDMSPPAQMPPPPGPPQLTASASCIEPECEKPQLDCKFKHDVMEDYAQKICEAIQSKHNDAYYQIDDDINAIKILNFDNEPILIVKVGEKMTVNMIMPTGELFGLHPLHSPSFYQKYWKPIVEALGHIYLEEHGVLMGVDVATLPDVPSKEQDFCIEGWDTKNQRNATVNVSFKGDNMAWFMSPSTTIKTAQSNNVSKYTEQDYINAIVKCVDGNLKSIYGRTGSVIQLIPNDEYLEIDVDFGEGLDVVRLTEDQIEIVPIP